MGGRRDGLRRAICRNGRDGRTHRTIRRDSRARRAIRHDGRLRCDARRDSRMRRANCATAV